MDIMSERSKLLSRRGKGKQMEKKEVQKFIKNKMKELGFRSRGNGLYKILDDNYLIGDWNIYGSSSILQRIFY